MGLVIKLATMSLVGHLLGFYGRFVVVPVRSVNGESVLLPNTYLLAVNAHLRESGSTGVQTAFSSMRRSGLQNIQ